MEEKVGGDSYRLPGTTCRNAGRFVAVMTEPDRFWRRVRLARGSACWLWLGGVNRYGYGTFRRTVGRRMVLAHRFAYELLVGPIPAGLTLDHLCGTPACVRPSHLEAVTNSENLRRRHARQRAMNGERT